MYVWLSFYPGAARIVFKKNTQTYVCKQAGMYVCMSTGNSFYKIFSSCAVCNHVHTNFRQSCLVKLSSYLLHILLTYIYIYKHTYIHSLTRVNTHGRTNFLKISSSHHADIHTHTYACIPLYVSKHTYILTSSNSLRIFSTSSLMCSSFSWNSCLKRTYFATPHLHTYHMYEYTYARIKLHIWTCKDMARMRLT